MAYIIFVNPNILSAAGMPKDALMVSTCLAAAFATFVMAFVANFPIALASGMGLNAFFAFTVVIGMKIPWETALAAIFIEGIIFIALTFSRVRESVVNGIPRCLKQGIAAGVGLFIAFIGIQGGGLVKGDAATLVTSAGLKGNFPAIFTLFGLIIICAMEARRVRGAILWGIIITTAVAVLTGVVSPPGAIVSAPPSIAPIFMKMDFSGVGIDLRVKEIADFWVVVFTFFFIDFFDTIGGLIALGSRAGFLDRDGNLPGARAALFADALGTSVGAMLGVSTVTTYAESASGIGAGGRTGLTSVVTGALFILAIFFSPLVSVVPSFATAPALIFVGVYMMMDIGCVDFSDWTELMPAMTCIFVMPFSYGISVGIEYSFIVYAAVKTASGRAREVSPIIWVMAALFLAKEFLI
jgi:AGZA family xanthine/uracil permease-like MFS transporter